MLLAASAASAALAIGVPGAYAAVGSDHEDSSYSKEEYSKDENGKEDKDKDSYKDEDKDYDKGDKDYDKHDKDYDKKDDYDKDYDKKDDYDKEDKDDKDEDKDKPNGGVHTGGGALTLLNEDSKDEDSYKDEDKDSYKDEDKDSYKDEDKDYDKGDKDSYKHEDKDDYDKHDKGYDKHDKDSYKHEDKDDYDKDDKEDKDEDKDKPSGGVHTGGGALTLLNEDGWGSEKGSKHEDSGYSKDEDSHGYKDKHEDSGYSKDDENKDSWGSDHDKPSGGVHTGGGALAAPTATAGGLAVLALAGAGLYTARRRKSAGSAV
jgi:hypothetical protein